MMTIPSPQQILRSLGVHKIKYDRLETWESFEKSNKHVFFMLDLSHFFSLLFRFYPDTKLLTSSNQPQYIDGLAVEVLNTIAHFRNYFTDHKKKRFTSIVFDSRKTGVVPCQDSVLARVKEITDFLPSCYALDNLKDVDDEYEKVAVIGSLINQMRSKSEVLGLKPLVYIYTSNHLYYSMCTQLGETVRFIHYSNAKEYGRSSMLALYLENGIDPQKYAKIELKTGFLASMSLFSTVYPDTLKKSILSDMVKKVQKLQIVHELLLDAGLGKNPEEMINTVYDDLILRHIKGDVPTQNISDVKNICYKLLGVKRTVDHEKIISAIFLLWKNKIYDRKLHAIGDYLMGFKEDQRLHIEWLQ